MTDSEKSDSEEKVARKGGVVPPGKGSTSSSSKLRANVAITMQKDVLSDLRSTLEEIKSTPVLSKIALQTYRAAIDADLESANKYNKNILGSTRLSIEAIEEYSNSKIYKTIFPLTNGVISYCIASSRKYRNPL